MYHSNAEESEIRVELGLVVATPAAMDVLEAAGVEAETLLLRHQSGDWGEVPPEDAELNEANLERGAMVMSVYSIEGSTLWIVTNPLEGSTTILLPEEY